MNINSTDNSLSPGQCNKRNRRLQLENYSKLSTSFFVNVRQGNPRKDDGGKKGNLRRSKFKNDFLATVYGQAKELRSDIASNQEALKENRLDVSVGTFNAAISFEKQSTPRNRTDEKDEAAGMTKQRLHFTDGEQNGDERKKKKHKKTVEDVDVGEVRVKKKKKKEVQSSYGQAKELRSDVASNQEALKENRLDVSVGTFNAAISFEKQSTPRNRTDEKDETAGMTKQRLHFTDGEQNGDERKKKKHKKTVEDVDVGEVRVKKKKKKEVDDSIILENEDSYYRKVKKKDKAEEEVQVDINSDGKSERKKKKRKNRDSEGASSEVPLSTASSDPSQHLSSEDGSCERTKKVKKKKKHKAEQSLEEEVELVTSNRAEKDCLTHSEEGVSVGTNFENSFDPGPVKKKKKKERRDVEEDSGVEKKEGGLGGDADNLEFEGNNADEEKKGRKKEKRKKSLSAGNENLSEINPKGEDTVRPKETAVEVTKESKKKKTEVAGPKTNEGEQKKPTLTYKPKKIRRLYNEDFQTFYGLEQKNKANEKKNHLDVLLAQMEKSYENKLAKNKVSEKPVKHLDDLSTQMEKSCENKLAKNKVDEKPVEHLDGLFTQMEKSYENKLMKKEKKKKKKKSSVEMEDRLSYEAKKGMEDVEKSELELEGGSNIKKGKHEKLLKPKIEIFEEDLGIENLNDLIVCLPFTPPPLHTIETRMSTRPTKEQVQQIEALGIPIRKGKFLKAEDEKIVENWKDFCERHRLPDDKGPFLKFVHAVVSPTPVLAYEERIKFVQYLARGLDDRLLWTVYTRFQTMFTPTLKGNFTPEEDRIIMEYMRQHIGDSKTYSVLAQKLTRPRLLVEKRYRDLMLQKQYETTGKRKMYRNREILNALMQHLNIDDVQKLKDRKITKEEWEAVSATVKMLPFNAKKVWLTTVYPSLFSVERSKFKILRTLVDLIYDSGATDRNEVKYSDYVKYFDGCTKEALSKWLNGYFQFVPDRRNRSFRETIAYLKERYFPNRYINDTIRNIDESYRSEEDREVTVKQEDCEVTVKQEKL